MSHAEYIKPLTYDQLENLIAQATAKREAIRRSGWARLWTVNIGFINVGWFKEDDYASAVEFACEAVKKAAAKDPKHEIEMTLTLDRYRPDEIEELLSQHTEGIKPADAQEGAKP